MKLYAFDSCLKYLEKIPLYPESVVSQMSDGERAEIKEMTEEVLLTLSGKGKSFFLKLEVTTKESLDNLAARVQEFI